MLAWLDTYINQQLRSTEVPNLFKYQENSNHSEGFGISVIPLQTLCHPRHGIEAGGISASRHGKPQ